jgi:hypothetical protein
MQLSSRQYTVGGFHIEYSDIEAITTTPANRQKLITVKWMWMR